MISSGNFHCVNHTSSEPNAIVIHTARERSLQYYNCSDDDYYWYENRFSIRNSLKKLWVTVWEYRVLCIVHYISSKSYSRPVSSCDTLEMLYVYNIIIIIYSPRRIRLYLCTYILYNIGSWVFYWQALSHTKKNSKIMIIKFPSLLICAFVVMASDYKQIINVIWSRCL